MKNKSVVLLFDIEWFERLHLLKDVGMVPSYLNKLFGLNTSIVFYDHNKNKDLLSTELGIHLIRVKQNILNKLGRLQKFFSPMSVYLIKNAKNIDVLMLFHLKKENYYYRLLYKLFNPNGKIYLKLDINLGTIESLRILKEEEMRSINPFKYQGGFISYLKTIKRKYDFKRMKYELARFDCISTEFQYALDKVEEYLGDVVKNKMILITNGFPHNDDTIKIRTEFNQKENTMITVGRIGTYQKNTEMLFSILERIKFNDWKFHVIGPIEEHFKNEIEKFYKRNPSLTNHVIFTGNVTDKQSLYEWYAKSKVFCLTSRFEGFPLVFPEAIYFGDYVVSTKVGAEGDITKQGELGKIIDQDDVESFVTALQDIIDGKESLENKFEYILDHSREHFIWDSIIAELYYKLFPASITQEREELTNQKDFSNLTNGAKENGK